MMDGTNMQTPTNKTVQRGCEGQVATRVVEKVVGQANEKDNGNDYSRTKFEGLPQRRSGCGRLWFMRYQFAVFVYDHSLLGMTDFAMCRVGRT